jgi:hypothetical protein
MFNLGIGLATYIGTAALGTAAQLRLVNTHPFRWLHHVLFALVWFTLGGVLITSWGRPWFVIMLPTALCMLVMPRLRAGTRPHCTAAVIGLVGYVVAFCWSLAGGT